MTGTLINAGVIVAAGAVGLLLRRGIPENIARSLQDAMGLLILIIGIQYGLKTESLVVVGLSLALGTVFGEWRNWEGKLENTGKRLKRLLGQEENLFVKGFVSATLVFCVGAMAILGALQDGLTHNYDILLVKSMLDGIMAMIFAASMGIGVLFSALPLLLYQGAISLGAGFLKPFLTDPVINNLTGLGGIIIAGIGLNTLGLARIRLANLLPGLLLVPLLMFLF
ncbi:DUF554 domain-containing protein [Syntrophomonas wolfei]|uniref:DUF554 domain-containing protein n=1 Tax=Syntrophomonas wolfei subsp. wolfei (strain DSM 2245B / Goettingen) TaxID=335541 RepID=Q0AZZ4_SYNWW|nr:DUF554 domain-containing protein [Syntrophomonas wolfei]ABI67710.1 conserved hypothetical protein [Syntrophomonas wolfei subsp. wolfei str. Goettingen G311]